MRWLNERVPYRYSAVFGFDGDRLHNICLIDKENPNISKCPDQPITDSYCMYIQRSGDRFSVETALKDSRVAGHPKQRSFQCYYGIPLYGPDGQMLGTVCHFDGLPIRVTEEIASALDEVGPLIADAAFSVKTDRWIKRAPVRTERELDQDVEDLLSEYRGPMPRTLVYAQLHTYLDTGTLSRPEVSSLYTLPLKWPSAQSAVPHRQAPVIGLWISFEEI
jgi:GAF domain-containing protein